MTDEQSVKDPRDTRPLDLDLYREDLRAPALDDRGYPVKGYDHRGEWIEPETIRATRLG